MWHLLGRTCISGRSWNGWLALLAAMGWTAPRAEDQSQMPSQPSVLGLCEDWCVVFTQPTCSMVLHSFGELFSVQMFKQRASSPSSSYSPLLFMRARRGMADPGSDWELGGLDGFREDAELVNEGGGRRLLCRDKISMICRNVTPGLVDRSVHSLRECRNGIDN